MIINLEYSLKREGSEEIPKIFFPRSWRSRSEVAASKLSILEAKEQKTTTTPRTAPTLPRT
jgi:hypothetical protein